MEQKEQILLLKGIKETGILQRKLIYIAFMERNQRNAVNKEQSSQKETNEEEQATAQILPLCMNQQDTQTRTAENKGTYGSAFFRGEIVKHWEGIMLGFLPVCQPTFTKADQRISSALNSVGLDYAKQRTSQRQNKPGVKLSPEGLVIMYTAQLLK